MAISEKNVDISFDLVPEKQVEAAIANEYTRIDWTGRSTKNIARTTDQIRESIAQGIREGQDYTQMANNVSDRLGKSAADMQRIARTEGHRAKSLGQYDLLQNAREKGLNISKQWIAALDEQTRDSHAMLDGKIVKMDEEFVSPTTGARAEAPGTFGRGDEDINCFDDITEILTERRGFVKFKDLLNDDKVATLNPATKQIEYLKPINYISYHYQGKMYNIKNLWADFMVTPNHMIPCITKDRYHRNKDANITLVRMDELKHGSYIPKVGKWEGNSLEQIKINGKKYNTELFVEFLGWYLSEGSTTDVSNSKHKKGTKYQINISQNEGADKDRVAEICKKLFVKVWVGKEKVYIIDDSIAEYLFKLGKSNEKYIPYEVKQLSSYYLDILLNSFCKGDGSFFVSRPANFMKANTKFKVQRRYFTSSKTMANDIAELILKINRYPYITEPKPEDYGKEVKFGNGTYKTNNPVYKVYENKTKNLFYQHKYTDIIDYDGMVYCVEVPKNNIIYVKRNGKCIWSGNCRCSMVGVFPGEAFEYRGYPYDDAPGSYIGKYANYMDWARKKGIKHHLFTGAKFDVGYPMFSDELLNSPAYQNLIKKYADERGMTVEQYNKAVAKEMTRLNKNADTVIRAPSTILDKIIKDGRFKSQFETGSSGGMFNPESRRGLEKQIFKAPTTLENSKRPIYGMLSDESVHHWTGAQYGNTIIKLDKSKILNRTTYSYADSLAAYGQFQPAKLTAPHIAAFPAQLGDPLVLLRNTKGLGGLPGGAYAEIQIHGGVSVDLIQKVTFTDVVKQSTLDALTKAGIKFDISNATVVSGI